MSEGGTRKSYGTGACKEEEEEEEEAVAVIAGVLREKFGPQIVSEEVEAWGSGIGSSEDEEGVGIVNEEEGGEEEEEEEEEAEAEACEEDAPPTTSPPTPPPLLNGRRPLSAELAIASTTVGGWDRQGCGCYNYLCYSRRIPPSAGPATAATATAEEFSGVGAGILAGMGAGMRAGILAGMGAGMLDVLQPFLWVAVSPAVAEELLFRGLLFTTLQERLGRIDAAMLSAALFHLSLALLFPNMALGIAASLLAVYSKSVLPAVALHTTYNASALIYALMAATIASV
ncbi:unnamed protein product [Closterium sp. Naga37s-1]|nr:unnamed protein product [Closterium sp. Naga37s-1]